MVSEDNFSDGVFKTRPVLSDVTNRPAAAKRPFSSISADSLHKSGDSHFAKQLCLGVENLVKRNCELQFGPSTHQNDDDEVPFQQPKGNGNQNQNHPSLTLPFPDTSLQNLPTQKPNSPRSVTVTEEQNLLDGGGVVSSLVQSSLDFGDGALQGRITCGVSEGRTLTERLSNRAVQSDEREEDCVVDKSVEPPAISASRDYGFPGLERCSALKEVSGANPAVSSGDLLKYCSCSFCSKAAYIWTDLHYQDVKGRLGALKKSQKEASTMLHKFNALKDKVIHDPQSSAESSKLELSLMEQWKSLFVHMENTFAHESKQLESNFEALKNLRGNCKNDLDLTDNSHSDNR